jgi:integrase
MRTWSSMAKRSKFADPWSVESKLTDTLVAALTPAKGNRIRWDGGHPGFGCRVTSAGAKAFVFRYRNADKVDRTYTIGSPPAWTVAKAVDRYKALLRDVDQDGDPLADREGQRGAPTMADLADRYKREHATKLRPGSSKEYIAIIDKLILPELRSNTKVAAVRHIDVDRMHRKIMERAPYRANRTVAVLSKMLSLAVKWEWRSDNPARGIERASEHKRERYLSPQEIARLSDALNQHPERISANAIRLLLLTGARRGETLSARWDQFDLSAGVWVKSSHATKQAKTHRVPLSAPALALLSEMKAEAEPGAKYLFPSGDAHLTEIKKSWASLCKAANISGARVHDLRHSYASVLASAGLSLPIIGQLLGHTQPATTARYAHLLDDALRAATERAGAIIMGNDVSTAEVVPITSRRRA